MKNWTDEEWIEHLGDMRNWTDGEWAQYLGDVKPDEEYTEEDISKLRKKQMQIERELRHKNKHAELQLLLDVCAKEFEQGGQNSH